MLIGQNGEKLGLKSLDKALEQAQQSELDLVQVSPSGSNQLYVSLWIMENTFLLRKKHLILQAKTKRVSIKEIKFRPSTDIGDYNIKLKNKSLFLVEIRLISVRFRREDS